MIDIHIGKALIAVETERAYCDGCAFAAGGSHCLPSVLSCVNRKGRQKRNIQAGRLAKGKGGKQ